MIHRCFNLICSAPLFIKRTAILPFTSLLPLYLTLSNISARHLSYSDVTDVYRYWGIDKGCAVKPGAYTDLLTGWALTATGVLPNIRFCSPYYAYDMAQGACRDFTADDVPKDLLAMYPFEGAFYKALSFMFPSANGVFDIHGAGSFAQALRGQNNPLHTLSYFLVQINARHSADPHLEINNPSLQGWMQALAHRSITDGLWRFPNRMSTFAQQIERGETLIQCFLLHWLNSAQEYHLFLDILHDKAVAADLFDIFFIKRNAAPLPGQAHASVLTALRIQSHVATLLDNCRDYYHNSPQTIHMLNSQLFDTRCTVYIKNNISISTFSLLQICASIFYDAEHGQYAYERMSGCAKELRVFFKKYRSPCRVPPTMLTEWTEMVWRVVQRMPLSYPSSELSTLAVLASLLGTALPQTLPVRRITAEDPTIRTSQDQPHAFHTATTHKYKDTLISALEYVIKPVNPAVQCTTRNNTSELALSDSWFIKARDCEGQTVFEVHVEFKYPEEHIPVAFNETTEFLEFLLANASQHAVARQQGVLLPRSPDADLYFAFCGGAIYTPPAASYALQCLHTESSAFAQQMRRCIFSNVHIPGYAVDPLLAPYVCTDCTLFSLFYANVTHFQLPDYAYGMMVAIRRDYYNQAFLQTLKIHAEHLLSLLKSSGDEIRLLPIYAPFFKNSLEELIDWPLQCTGHVHADLNWARLCIEFAHTMGHVDIAQMVLNRMAASQHTLRAFFSSNFENVVSVREMLAYCLNAWVLSEDLHISVAVMHTMTAADLRSLYELLKIYVRVFPQDVKEGTGDFLLLLAGRCTIHALKALSEENIEHAALLHEVRMTLPNM